MTPLDQLETRRDTLLNEIRALGDMRRGTLLERYLPCGKPGCHCARPGSKGHGPKFSLTYKVQGKTKTEYIPEDQVKQVREQLANHQRFVALCRELVEINEELCRLRVEEKNNEAKKNSGRRSKKKSRRKSTGL